MESLYTIPKWLKLFLFKCLYIYLILKELDERNIIIKFLYCRFTTIEGILIDIRDGLSNNPFLMGDSSSDDVRSKTLQLLADLDKVSSKLNFYLMFCLFFLLLCIS